MANTIRILYALCVLLILVFCISCTNNVSGTSSDESPSVALALRVPYTYQEPKKVIVNLSVGNNNYTDETGFLNQDGITFTDLPLGEACINVDAFTENMVKILDGRAETHLNAGSNNINVLLNNVFLSYYINDISANTFMQNPTDKSDFWNANYPKSFIHLEMNTPQTIVEVRAAYGVRGYYFLFEISDHDYMIGPTDQVNEYGEWLNDAVIVYIAKSASTDMAEFDGPNRSYIRIQCMVGADPPENGPIKITEFIGTNVDDFQENTINNFADGRIIQKDAVNRIFELFVDDNYLKINGDPSERVAFAVRYINNTQGSAPKMVDWKNKREFDPKTDREPWGNLELRQP